MFGAAMGISTDSKRPSDAGPSTDSAPTCSGTKDLEDNASKSVIETTKSLEKTSTTQQPQIDSNVLDTGGIANPVDEKPREEKSDVEKDKDEVQRRQNGSSNNEIESGENGTNDAEKERLTLSSPREEVSPYPDQENNHWGPDDEIRDLKRRLLDIEVRNHNKLDAKELRAKWEEAEARDGEEAEFRSWEEELSFRKKAGMEERYSYLSSRRWERQMFQNYRRKLREEMRYVDWLASERREWEEWREKVRGHRARSPSADGNTLEVKWEGEGQECAPTRNIPKLNRVEWKAFKSLQPPALKETYAIDVLVGEPVITFGPMFPRGRYSKLAFKISQEVMNASDDTKTRDRTRTKPLAAGQGPLPERIRINSKPVIKILEKIHGEKISNSDREPILIFRPFKTLIFYEEEIRAQHRKLEIRFGSTVDESGRPADLPSGLTENSQPAESTHSKKDEAKNKEGPPKKDDPTEEEEDNEINSQVALNDLRCLIEFMDKDLNEKKKYLNSDVCQKVSFSDIWHLFKPGDVVFGKNGRQTYRVINVVTTKHMVKRPDWRNTFKFNLEENPITIHCVYIDYDGKSLGPVSQRFVISRYDGEQNITSLPIYPFRFGEKATSRDELIKRGKTFLDVAAVKHMHFAGLTLETRDEVDSQVIIDFEEAFVRHAEWKPTVEQLADGDHEADTQDESEEVCVDQCCKDEIVHDDAYVERNRKEEFIQSQLPEIHSKPPSLAIFPRSLQDARGENFPTIDELLIITNRVFAFILRSRKWAKLDLTDVTEVKRVEDQDGFDQLVLPDGHKDMVKSLIKQHFREKESKSADKEQVDIVRGKGKGLIMLLHGAPGVGKTSTAECVADSFRKPLFQITCGDLGSTASDVEAALETNFSLANRWGCILLIDEADIFLAERTRHDFLRNSLVAVFLRVLEYYAGILFLTTNRVGAFDEAFTSRIHVSLYYPPLDEPSTAAVFEMNMRRIKDRFIKKKRRFDFKEGQISVFAADYFRSNEEGRWNGRQIRNAFQTALALAEYEAQGGGAEDDADKKDPIVTLDAKHFKTVADAYLGFVDYLRDVYGGAGASRRARENHARDDGFGIPKSWNALNTRLKKPGLPPSVPFEHNYPSAHQPERSFQNHGPPHFAGTGNSSGSYETHYYPPASQWPESDPGYYGPPSNSAGRPPPTEQNYAWSNDRSNNSAAAGYNPPGNPVGRPVPTEHNHSWSNDRGNSVYPPRHQVGMNVAQNGNPAQGVNVPTQRGDPRLDPSSMKPPAGPSNWAQQDREDVPHDPRFPSGSSGWAGSERRELNPDHGYAIPQPGPPN